MKKTFITLISVVFVLAEVLTGLSLAGETNAGPGLKSAPPSAWQSPFWSPFLNKVVEDAKEALEGKKAQEIDAFAELQEIERVSDEKVANGIYKARQGERVNRDGSKIFISIMNVPAPNENWDVIATAAIGWDGKKHHHSVLLSVVKNGERLGLEIPLDYLAKKYYDMTGKKMNAVKLIGFEGHDKKIGNYAQIMVYPLDTASEVKIKKEENGCPYMILSYAGGNTYGDGQDNILIASR